MNAGILNQITQQQVAPSFMGQGIVPKQAQGGFNPEDLLKHTLLGRLGGGSGGFNPENLLKHTLMGQLGGLGGGGLGLLSGLLNKDSD